MHSISFNTKLLVNHSLGMDQNEIQLIVNKLCKFCSVYRSNFVAVLSVLSKKEKKATKKAQLKLYVQFEFFSLFIQLMLEFLS